ncbi:MAG: cobalamin biosynthesis protein P47K [Acidobacteria bacterium]|nr:cobalamin biosynthesis protein P47K [Acidobacteriota bacterium]
MVGGFLGAGKTTALLRLAAHLTAGGRRVGLITNDQSSGLADTALVDSYGYPVQEISGGCFCCRFNSLTAAVERLTAASTPDVFLAEPVGSCTDLRASVQYPLRRLSGGAYRIAPLSVLVDPIRAARILGLDAGKAFSPKVRYVYGTQLEEAEVIVINKADLLDTVGQERLERALRQTYPHADVRTVSARTGAGLDGWFARVLDLESDTRPAPMLDYDAYAEGEALLGWCNATFRVDASAPFDGNALLTELATGIRDRLIGEIAHVKMTLAPLDEGRDIGAVNLVDGEGEPELSHALQDEVTCGELIVNLRAEADPERLRQTTIDALAAVAGRHRVATSVVHIEHFRPARPSPTHRMATADARGAELGA